jgi:CheY-like chemotaxis protein
MLRKILQNLGMTVDTVDSAEEALDYLRGQKPDAIFMDHTMPGMDGLMALRQIKKTPATAAIPVAMYTSKDEPAYRDEAHAAGAVGVLSKPATSEALGAILDKMSAQLDVAVRPPAALTPAGEGVTTAWIEKLVLEKSERFFYDAIESQVLPLINDVVAKLRSEVELKQEETSSRIAARVLEKRLATWQPSSLASVNTEQTVETVLRTQLPSLLEERLKTFQRQGQADGERLARQIATEVCQDQLHQLTDQLVRQVSTRFTEAAQKAEGAAREAALAAARATALQAVAEAKATSVKDNPAEVATRVAQQLWTETQHDVWRRIYLAAGGAAAAGIGAALLVYGLR